MKLRLRQKGDWSKTTAYLKSIKELNNKIRPILEQYGSAGILALANATPKDTGLTASSWDYNIEITSKGYSISWFNTNEVNGTPIVILIQYGHGTGTGGYIPPRDFINPTMKPIFDKLADDLWKEVSRL